MFIFDKYTFDEKTKKAEFFYKIEKRNKNNPKQFDIIHSFKEELDFSNVKFRENIDPWLLKNCLYFLHLTLWVSYWKTTCEKGIKVFSWNLKRWQSHFFERLYKRGLWEFFYKNQIEFRGLVNFPYSKISWFRKREIEFTSKKAIVPIWWGKDSTLTLDLLKKNWIDFDIFTLWKYAICEKIWEHFWKKVISIWRKIDPKLIELNKNPKIFNGHIPISSIYSAISIFIAWVSGYSDIIFSNEASANEENTTWNWMKINHQYSKSLEFEDYLQEFIHTQIWNINYFSILRPFTEAKITKLFVENCEDTFDIFASCNSNFVISKEKPKNKWCQKCPKCAFVFVMFSAYIWVKKTSEIFWKNLFEDKNLTQIFIDLVWKWEMKPFECVWTYWEIQSAFAKIIEDWNSWVILDKIKKFWFKNNLEEFENFAWAHMIPDDFEEIINKVRI